MFSNRNGPTHHSVDVSRERLSKIVSLARAHEADLLALDASDSYDDAGGGHVHLSGVNWGGQAEYRLRPRAV